MIISRTINADGVIEEQHLIGDKLHLSRKADITDLLERNKQERNNSNNGFTKEGDMRKIAELDMLTVYKLKEDYNIDVFNADDMPRLKKWLKDNRAFTTVSGGF